VDGCGSVVVVVGGILVAEDDEATTVGGWYVYEVSDGPSGGSMISKQT